MNLQSYPDIAAMVSSLEPSYPVYCLRPQVLRENAARFLARFPGDVLYAVKCNPHPDVLRELYAAGIRHFDTASLSEIADVHELFADAQSYFMHPVKPRAVIRTARDVYGVGHYVVDHMDELNKLLEELDGEAITVMVRMATPAGGATYELSRKFGADPGETVRLLKEIGAHGLKRGVAFHVGSQCLRTNAYETALELVGSVCDAAGELDYLDVGGGFPSHYEGVLAPPLEAFIDAIEHGLRRVSLPPHARVMCEPGRAMVANAMSLVVQVQLRKDNQIYINDGIYGSLSEAAVGGIRYPARLVGVDGAPRAAEQMDFTVNGPTCDSFDVLPSPFRLPADVCEGDWIEIEKLGAYSNANRTHFNGFYPETMVAIDTADHHS